LIWKGTIRGAPVHKDKFKTPNFDNIIKIPFLYKGERRVDKMGADETIEVPENKVTSKYCPR
jgi:hypothetical protein